MVVNQSRACTISYHIILYHESSWRRKSLLCTRCTSVFVLVSFRFVSFLLFPSRPAHGTQTLLGQFLRVKREQTSISLALAMRLATPPCKTVYLFSSSFFPRASALPSTRTVSRGSSYLWMLNNSWIRPSFHSSGHMASHLHLT